MLLVHEKEFTLRESDFDCFDHIKASAVLDLFQTVAAEHVTLFGASFEDMLAKNLAWVVTKIRFDVLAPLRSSEKVTVKTVPHAKKLIDYVRDYYVVNSRGETVIKGSSQWVLIDFTTRKIARTDFDFDGEFSDEYAYPNERLKKVPVIAEPELLRYEIRRADLDHNRHVNNVRYLDMIFDAEKDPSLPLRSVSINYTEEVREGETVTICGDGGIYSGFSDSRPRFSAEITRASFDK